MAFQNRAQMKDSKGNSQIRRWRHQELHIDHYDIHVHIYGGDKSGKVKFTRPVRGSDEYDEIELPVSLLYKVSDLLKLTRSSDYVSVAALPKEELEEIKAAEELEKK